MNYSDNQLTALAKNNPIKLASVLSSLQANIRMLSFGAEILGTEVNDEKIVLPVLKHLLNHIHAVVREGALIGLSSFFSGSPLSTDIFDQIKNMSINDPSPTIKEICVDLTKE